MAIERKHKSQSLEAKSIAKDSRTSTISEKSNTKIKNTLPNKNLFRPQSLNEYIGQSRLKQILDITINAAKQRNDIGSIGHILLHGQAGLGKTSCALLIADLLQTKAHILTATALNKPKDIIGIILNAQEGDIIFIDEIHRLNKVTEELLYPVMEDCVLDLSTGKSQTARIRQIALPKFTIVGATTNIGQLTAPFRDRFMHHYHMQPYSEDELIQIILQNYAKINTTVNLSTDNARYIIKASRGVPRKANNLLKIIVDYSVYKNQNINRELIQEALEIYGLDLHGLSYIDYNILNTIKNQYNGGPVGLDALATHLGIARQTLEEQYEPYLLQQNYIARTHKGRILNESLKQIDSTINYQNII